MSFQSGNDNIDQAKNSIFSSFKEGFILQLSDAIKCLGQISVIAITILIPFLILWFSKGTSVGDHCIMNSPNVPIIGGVIASVGLLLMLGNPFIAILAGTFLGVILNIPFVQQLLC